VSEFTKEIDELLPTDALTPIKTSPLPQKVRKEANQLRRVLPQISGAVGNLPTMLVAYDPLGAQTHRRWSSCNGFWGWHTALRLILWLRR
jgi:hypothetical protein